MEPGDSLSGKLSASGEDVLPMLVAASIPDWVSGLYIAIVLAAIMSTVDSLLVLASSAFVRDYYQKVRHPEIPDNRLLGLSRMVTLTLAVCALAVAFSVAIFIPGRTVFWFTIFGWSGISATFCPTMILSLFWSKLTSRGAFWAMLSGFFSVPFFKFVAPQIPFIGENLSALSELPPAFVVSGSVAIIVSLLDRKGLVSLSEIPGELEESR